MATKLTFSDYYEILLKKVDEIRNELEDIIVNKIEEVPFIDEIKTTDQRYNYYSKAVKLSLKTSQILSNAYFTKDAIIRVKQKLQKDTVTPSKLVMSWIRDTDNLIQDADGIILSAKSFKEGLDNLVKFYQSVCYMFGGILEVKSSI